MLFCTQGVQILQPVYIRETALENATSKHGKTIGVLRLNIYGNPSGTYYYIDGLLLILRKIRAKKNEAEVFLIRIDLISGSVIAAISVDNFLATASTMKAMNGFYESIASR